VPLDGGAPLWDVVRAFVEARSAFRSIYRRYERRVLAAAKKREGARQHLVLPPEKLFGLFDLAELECLRDERLSPLKRQAEALFGESGDEGLLDTYCGHALSEVAILCEEHRAVGRFVRIHDPERYRELFQEVSGFYPTRLRRVRRFFRLGLARLEELLPAWARHRVVVRSAYLFGEALARDAWREDLPGLYARMYPEGRAARGFLEAARSFHAAGFDDQAREALARAVASVDQAPAPGRQAVPVALATEVRAFARALAQSPAPATETRAPEAGASGEGAPGAGRASP
jgi:hypothetical protein